MPQLASNVKWNGNYVFGSDPMAARPELATVVATTISAWSITEAHLGRTFAALIGAKQPVTMSMYMAVRSFDVQRDMLVAAVWELAVKQVHHSKFVAASTSPLVSLFGEPKLDHRHIYVYQLKDLHEAQNRVERAFWIAEALRRLATSNAPRRQKLYKMLCSDDHIQKAVAETKKKNPVRSKAKPARPRKG